MHQISCHAPIKKWDVSIAKADKNMIKS